MTGKNALTFLEPTKPNQPPVPVYDLTGDRICIALLINHPPNKLEFYVHLKPPTQERTLRLLSEREGYGVAVTGKDAGMDLESGPVDVDRKFFDEHVIAVGYQGKELTTDQLDLLDRRYNLKVNTITRGLLAVGTPEGSQDDAAPTIEELLSESPTVEQRILLADDTGTEHELRIVHHFEMPTARQSTDFQRSQKMRVKDHGVRRFIIKFKDIVKLYDAMISTVDGVTGGLANLPVVWKINAVQMVFRDAERKNV
jgi:hypothetical protein